MVHDAFEISSSCSCDVGVGGSCSCVVFADVISVIRPCIFQVDQKHVVELCDSYCFHYILPSYNRLQIKAAFDQDGSHYLVCDFALD